MLTHKATHGLTSVGFSQWSLCPLVPLESPAEAQSPKCRPHQLLNMDCFRKASAWVKIKGYRVSLLKNNIYKMYSPSGISSIAKYESLLVPLSFTNCHRIEKTPSSVLFLRVAWDKPPEHRTCEILMSETYKWKLFMTLREFSHAPASF